jgi:hypothetical protein
MVLGSIVAMTGVLPATQAAGQSVPLKLRAWAVNMSNIGTGSSAVVDITIDRWSTDDERQALRTTFVEKGPTSSSMPCRS